MVPKGERQNVLKCNNSAGIKLVQTEEKGIDTTLAFIRFMMAIKSYIARVSEAVVDSVSEFKV